MSEDLRQIAARIRELREIYGFTVAEIAEELGIDAALYERYEEDGRDIPISILYHLASKYNVDLTEILTGRTPRLDSFCVVPKGRGIKVDRYKDYRFQSLAYKFAHRVMEPLLVTLDPSDAAPALVTHAGQEFNLVLEGSIHFLFEDKKILLNEGDSVYFDPTRPHGQVCAGGAPAKFLTVITEQTEGVKHA